MCRDVVHIEVVSQGRTPSVEMLAGGHLPPKECRTHLLGEIGGQILEEILNVVGAMTRLAAVDRDAGARVSSGLIWRAVLADGRQELWRPRLDLH